MTLKLLYIVALNFDFVLALLLMRWGFGMASNTHWRDHYTQGNRNWHTAD